MDLSSVVPSSDPRSRLENSQLVRLQPVGILNFVIFRYVPIRGEDNLVFFFIGGGRGRGGRRGGDNLGEAEEFLNIDMNVALFFFFSV